MKIAALYDIHGNLPALNAILDELNEVKPDLIVVGGDIIAGPMPVQTLERLELLGDQVRFLSGNADRETVLTFDRQPLKRHYLPDMSEKGLEEIRWVAAQITRTQRDFLAALPSQLVFQIEGLGSVLFCHATSRNDEELFTPITPEERLRTIFSTVEEDILVCGHTHMQFERSLDKLHIINAGSVGMPFAKQPGAYWLLLSSEGCEFRHTKYDGEAAAQIIQASDYPDAENFINENILQQRTIEQMTKLFESLAK